MKLLFFVIIILLFVLSLASTTSFSQSTNETSSTIMTTTTAEATTTTTNLETAPTTTETTTTTTTTTYPPETLPPTPKVNRDTALDIVLLTSAAFAIFSPHIPEAAFIVSRMSAASRAIIPISSLPTSVYVPVNYPNGSSGKKIIVATKTTCGSSSTSEFDSPLFFESPIIGWNIPAKRDPQDSSSCSSQLIGTFIGNILISLGVMLLIYVGYWIHQATKYRNLPKSKYTAFSNGYVTRAFLIIFCAFLLPPAFTSILISASRCGLGFSGAVGALLVFVTVILLWWLMYRRQRDEIFRYRKLTLKSAKELMKDGTKWRLWLIHYCEPRGIWKWNGSNSAEELFKQQREELKTSRKERLGIEVEEKKENNNNNNENENSNEGEKNNNKNESNSNNLPSASAASASATTPTATTTTTNPNSNKINIVDESDDDLDNLVQQQVAAGVTNQNSKPSFVLDQDDLLQQQQNQHHHSSPQVAAKVQSVQDVLVSSPHQYSMHRHQEDSSSPTRNKSDSSSGFFNTKSGSYLVGDRDSLPEDDDINIPPKLNDKSNSEFCAATVSMSTIAPGPSVSTLLEGQRLASLEKSKKQLRKEEKERIKSEKKQEKQEQMEMIQKHMKEKEDKNMKHQIPSNKKSVDEQQQQELVSAKSPQKNANSNILSSSSPTATATPETSLSQQQQQQGDGEEGETSEKSERRRKRQELIRSLKQNLDSIPETAEELDDRKFAEQHDPDEKARVTYMRFLMALPIFSSFAQSENWYFIFFEITLRLFMAISVIIAEAMSSTEEEDQQDNQNGGNSIVSIPGRILNRQLGCYAVRGTYTALSLILVLVTFFRNPYSHRLVFFAVMFSGCFQLMAMAILLVDDHLGAEVGPPLLMTGLICSIGILCFTAELYTVIAPKIWTKLEFTEFDFDPDKPRRQNKKDNNNNQQQQQSNKNNNENNKKGDEEPEDLDLDDLDINKKKENEKGHDDDDEKQHPLLNYDHLHLSPTGKESYDEDDDEQFFRELEQLGVGTSSGVAAASMVTSLDSVLDSSSSSSTRKKENLEEVEMDLFSRLDRQVRKAYYDLLYDHEDVVPKHEELVHAQEKFDEFVNI